MRSPLMMPCSFSLENADVILAGDWIPATIDLPRKREVLMLARLTNRSRHEVIGILFEFWAWASNESSTGIINGVTISQLPDFIPGVDPHFWHSLIEVGWLKALPEGMVLPNADRWITKAAKARMQATRRQSERRTRHPPSRSHRDKNATTGTVTKTLPQAP